MLGQLQLHATHVEALSCGIGTLRELDNAVLQVGLWPQFYWRIDCLFTLHSRSFVQDLNAMTVAESVLGPRTCANRRGGTADYMCGHL